MMSLPLCRHRVDGKCLSKRVPADGHWIARDRTVKPEWCKAYCHMADWPNPEDAPATPATVPPLPNTVTRASRLALAIVEERVAIKAGVPKITEEQYQARLAGCDGCEFNRDGVCGVCGCNLKGKVLAKARFRSQTCPHPQGSKWPPHPPAV